MPYLILAAALVFLSGPISATPSASSGHASQDAASGQLILVADNEVYGERNDDGIVDPDNYGYGYGDEENDDQDDSARNRDDDEDDGWDINEYERSERA